MAVQLYMERKLPYQTLEMPLFINVMLIYYVKLMMSDIRKIRGFEHKKLRFKEIGKFPVTDF